MPGNLALSCPSLSSYPVGRRETVTWGYSSAARAVALQAIGLGFKSPYLQRTWSLTEQGKGEEERAWSRWPERRRGVREERYPWALKRRAAGL
jgi:hypothetical protein